MQWREEESVMDVVMQRKGVLNASSETVNNTIMTNCAWEVSPLSSEVAPNLPSHFKLHLLRSCT